MFKRFVMFVVMASLFVACGPKNIEAASLSVNPPEVEPEWSYKIQAQPTDTTQTITVWAKPELQTGRPVLKWSDGFEVKLEWGKESEPFEWHSIEDATLVVDGKKYKPLLSTEYAEVTQGGGFLVWIP